MIEHLLVVSKSGVPILMRSYCDEELSTFLVAGFLSAISSFSEEAFHSDINQVQLNNKYLTFTTKIINGNKVLFILISKHCVGYERQEDCKCIPSSLKKISNEFSAKYPAFKLEDTVSPSMFADFGFLIDKIVDKHFRMHFCIKHLDTKDNIAFSDMNEKMLGFTCFKNKELFQYDLKDQFPTMRYQNLLRVVHSWNEIFQQELSPSFQINEFDEFKFVYSKFSGKDKSDEWSFFTFWKKNLPDSLLRDFHNGLIKQFKVR